MTLALILGIVAAWIVVSLPIALIMGRMPRVAERADLHAAEAHASSLR